MNLNGTTGGIEIASCVKQKMQNPIAIIGGGPGGLSAAIRAAELGLQVVLYEKGEIGSGIKCAEGFIDTLGMLGRPEGALYRVETAAFWTHRAHNVQLPEDCGIWMIDRCTWQRSLAEKAHGLGVSVNENHPISRSQLLAMLKSHSYIIDASGAPSVTSRMYGFVPAYLEGATLLVQYLIEGDFSHLGRNAIKIVFEPHFFGYHWVFPKGRDIANVGVGRYHLDERDRHINLGDELDRVLRKEGLDEYLIRKKVHSFAPSSGVTKLVWGNTLLVGDAAALCSPLHGGGIDMACISGRLAAELIASDQTSSYPAKLWDIIGKKLVMERRVRSLWQLLGHSFIRGIMVYPQLVISIIFSRRPVPQVLGLWGKKTLYQMDPDCLAEGMLESECVSKL